MVQEPLELTDFTPSMKVNAGELVCEGIWLDPVHRTRDWHTIGAIGTTVPMKMVVHANLTLISHDEKSNPLPQSLLGSWLRGVKEKNH